MIRLMKNQAGALSKALKVLKAIAQHAKTIDPFQYYSTPGESIYCVYLITQSGLAKKYVHLDADGKLICDLTIVENDSTENESLLEDFSFDSLNNYPPQLVDFEDLLREMHLVTVMQPHKLFKPNEMLRLTQIFPKDPIVIGGCGRSGTTLLLSILGSHSQIFAFDDERYPFYPYPFRLAPLLRELEVQEPQKWSRWCEKTPKNVRAFGSILNAFNGKAKLIHIVRDGRDVVTSHHPNHAEEYWVSPERWVADVSAGLEYRDNSFLVKYEDLVSQPEESIKAVCDYLGESFESEMLKPERHSKIKTSPAWESKQLLAVSEKAIGRWKTTGHAKRIEEFFAYPGAKYFMEELGYL